eukprot:3713658-Pyramimonas_sp.AAC.1
MVAGGGFTHRCGAAARRLRPPPPRPRQGGPRPSGGGGAGGGRGLAQHIGDRTVADETHRPEPERRVPQHSQRCV